MEMRYAHGDDGRAYYVKAHVPLEDFMAAVQSEVGADDPILREQPTHCWMRVCRDFQENQAVLVEAAPKSRGAFPATWVEDA